MQIIDVTSENVLEESLFCSKNIKSQGFKDKTSWFEKRYEEGLRLKILKNGQGKSVAFIEYVPASHAWRPVDADDFMFIHCMVVYSKKDRHKGYGSMLVEACEADAKARGLFGVTVMTSDGSWITNKQLFLKNGFEEVDRLGRFELLARNFSSEAANPKLIDWTAQQRKYKGWNLVYADQCPWHAKAVAVLGQVAAECGVALKVTKLRSAQQAKKAPSGFGVFSLIRDGELLADHYISESSFRKLLTAAGVVNA